MTRCRRAEGGLTLIELMVVIAVLGLVTATVSVRLSATVGPAAFEQAIAQWRFTDLQLRTRSRESGRATQLEIEIGSNRLGCVWSLDSPGVERTLGRGVYLTNYLSLTQERRQGPVTIDYDARGGSETYAIELTGSHNLRRWLLVAGFSGQITEVPDESTVRKLLEACAGLHAGGSRGEPHAVGYTLGGTAHGPSPAYAADSRG